jgi:hypothetical protein
MSYTNIVKPRAFEQNGKAMGDPTYSTEMIISAGDMGKFKRPNDEGGFDDVSLAAVAAEVAKAKWPDISVKDAVATGKLGWPINDGDDLADKKVKKGKSEDSVAAYRGNKIIRAKSNLEFAPRMYYSEEGKRKQINRGLESDEAKATQLFVAGSYAYAEITIRATSYKDDYVTLYLNSIKYVRQGERLGSASTMDRFDAGISGGEEDYDPTEGMDDDIPL